MYMHAYYRHVVRYIYTHIYIYTLVHTRLYIHRCVTKTNGSPSGLYELPIRGARMRAAGSSALRAAFAGSTWRLQTSQSGWLLWKSAPVVLTHGWSRVILIMQHCAKSSNVWDFHPGFNLLEGYHYDPALTWNPVQDEQARVAGPSQNPCA